MGKQRGATGARDAALILYAFFAAVVCWLSFEEYVFEDAYITYRYADNLAHGQGFAFNPGERVLGTTTPFFTLLLAFLGWLGADVAVAGKLVFTLALIGVALLGAFLLRRFGHPNLGVLYAVLVSWGTGDVFRFFGMETTLYASLLLATLWAAFARRPVATGVFLGLAFLTRYDAFMLTASLFVVLWIVEKRPPWLAYLTAGAVVLPWFIFAWAYFGSVLPQTLDAKARAIPMTEYMYSSAALLSESLFTPVLRFFPHFPYPNVGSALLLLALIGPVFAQTGKVVRREPRLLLLLLFPALLWLGYSLIGPPLGHRWYLLPGLHLLLLFALLCWGEVLSSARVTVARPTATATASLVLLLMAAWWLPAGVERELEERVHNVVYQKRVGVYRLFARYIEDHGLDDLKLYTREPGYLAYLTHNPVIDGAGLVTAGLYAHGPRDRQTSLGDALTAFEPSLIVGNDRQWERVKPAGYFPLVTRLSRTLLIRESVYLERLPQLLRRFFEPTFEHSEEREPLAHPLHFHFDEGNEGFMGSDSGRFVGPTRTFRYRGAPYESALAHSHVSFSRRNLIESPPFKIDFDELSFLWSGNHPTATRAEFLVNGAVVYTAAGSRAMAGELRRQVWPVHGWRGQVGRVRFVDEAASGVFVAFDEIRSARYENRYLFDDFEGEVYGRNWKSGFGAGPTLSSHLAARFGLGVVAGRRSAVSLGESGDRVVMSSRSFAIERDRMSFAVFDFSGDENRVALRIGGESKRIFVGKGSDRLVGVDWDVAEFRGQQAVLRVVDSDGDPERWIGIDDVVFYDRAVYDSPDAGPETAAVSETGAAPRHSRRNGR